MTNLAVKHKSECLTDVEEISKSLSAYHHKYQMIISHYSTEYFDLRSIVANLKEYPFTVDPMPYASINLINLAIEQAMIVHFDYDVLIGYRVGFWQDIEEYRSFVNKGKWLVPKLFTQIQKPVPIYKDIILCTEISKYRSEESKYCIWFTVAFEDYFTSEGIAIMHKNNLKR